jgi:uncharacterized repeat protein (TIGR01451 family)
VRRRTAFRPDALGRLEDRVVLSHVAMVHASRITPFDSALTRGAQWRPTLAVQSAGSNRVVVLKHTVQGGMAFDTQIIAPDASTATEASIFTYRIRYKNDGGGPTGSVSITDRLDPRMIFVPGSATVPAGGQFSTSTGPGASTVLHWELPSGLSAGESGSVTFQVKYRGNG